MIARGDLAFAIPLEDLPHIQKELIALGLRMGKPVITATHMLESMTHNLFPTRAEVTDVANAILDGTDAVMTSGETAKGKHPAVVIETMAKIIGSAQSRVHNRTFNDEKAEAEALTSGAAHIANQLGARLIIVFTESGKTARLVSRHRPSQIVIALSPNKNTVQSLAFTWGVFPQLIKGVKNVDAMMKVARQCAQSNGIMNLDAGEPFVVNAGFPFGESGSTNLIFAGRA
jgi:pyruvate kinase